MVLWRGIPGLNQHGYGDFKGKKRQRGGGKIRKYRRQRGRGEISEKVTKKILNEFSKAAKYGKHLARATKRKVKKQYRKFTGQKGGVYTPYRELRRYGNNTPEKFLMY